MANPPSGVRTTLLPGDVRELRLRRFALRVIDGPDKGAECLSSGPELAVGSAASNDLVLTDPTVSRHHFVLQVGPDGVIMRDLDSTNGTTLAGYRVGTAHLKPGAIVGLGLTTLRLDDLAEEIREPLSELAQFGRAIGSSIGMRRLFAALPRIAASDSTVLIEGETGTGKGVLAEAIHGASARAGGPFVVVDCASIPPSLIEAELFGHTRGAFTGAGSARAGAFESAAGGTVFLDEIGELPLAVQAKLLRVLEAQELQRVGDVKPRAVDIRIVAATNRDLAAEVELGRFRRDLFFRLGAAQVVLPPLRDRPRDLALLANRMFDTACRRLQRRSLALTVAATQALFHHRWPGNVRELRNAMDYAAAAAPDTAVEIDVWHLPPAVIAAARAAESETAAPPAREPATAGPCALAGPPLGSVLAFRPIEDEIRELERGRMIEALAATAGVQNRAAELIQMPLRTFVTKLKRYAIARADWKPDP